MLSNSDQMEALWEALEGSHRVVVAGHSSPDPDTIGSALAMTLALRSLGKNASAYFQDPLPWNMDFLPGRETTKNTLSDEEGIDLLVVVDAGSLDRIGDEAPRLHEEGKIRRWAIVDHHMSTKPVADINFIDDSTSSTGELVLRLLQGFSKRHEDFEVTKEMATCVYVALATDTGSFQHANTTSNTHLAAADCLKLGVDLPFLSNRLFRAMRKSRLDLMKRAIDGVSYHAEGRLMTFTLYPGDFSETGGSQDDAAGFASHFLGVEGVEMVAYFHQMEGGPAKMSLRGTERFNLGEFCARLGGGGHQRSAGMTLTGNLEGERDRIVPQLLEMVRS